MPVAGNQLIFNYQINAVDKALIDVGDKRGAVRHELLETRARCAIVLIVPVTVSKDVEPKGFCAPSATKDAPF